MSQLRNRHFVAAAVVAAELHKAMIVAKEISLTASNAKALALRAGSGAAGFRALTDFIDELAKKTIYTSREVNTLAVQISKIASQTARVSFALERFEFAAQKAKTARYVESIAPACQRTQQEVQDMKRNFDKRVWQLKSKLDDIARELRTGIVLSTMSRVEATQSGKENEASLYTIAQNVADAAEKIRAHVNISQQCFAHFH